MPDLAWDDLTKEEQGLLQRAHLHASNMFTVDQVAHMKTRGLFEEKLGGPGLSPKGKAILDNLAAALSRRRGLGS